ncbi:Transmembrane alpha-helix domain [Ceratobasidium sp. AG-Ba]|nr:Transmembrane alpha-helix domain [Ceratobasidium sp. AG-Ba]QRW09178.1 Transmembrane alpha-helix domain [Ceratobasidium sp. AG-Ba]
MFFVRLRGLALGLVSLAHLIQVAMGWAFQVPPRIVEGANAEFEVVDDGGGFYYPYTMTVLKKVLGQPAQQVGLVYTDVATFYWDCNQPAGTVLEFRLVSKANVNVASSGNMTVLPGAQAAASSVSVQSVASTASLFSRTAGSSSITSQAPQTGGSGTAQPSVFASATSGVRTENPKGVPVGVAVGVSIAGVVLLVALLFLIWRVRRLRQDKDIPEPAFRHEESITPFMHGQPHQHTPPLGYVSSYASPYEEPPEYAPPSQAPSSGNLSSLTGYPSTTYASTSAPSEGGQIGDTSTRDHSFVPSRYEKRRR